MADQSKTSFSKQGKEGEARRKRKPGKFLKTLHTRESHNAVTILDKDFEKQGYSTATFVFDETLSLDIQKGDEVNAALSPRTWKLYDFLNSKLAKNNTFRNIDRINRRVEININETAKELGYNTEGRGGRQKGRNAVIQHIALLDAMRIKQEVYDGGTIKTTYTRITDHVEIERTAKGHIKGISINVAATHLETLLMHGFIMYLPRALFAIDDKNPSAYAVGRFLCFYNNMEKNVKQGREDFISVQKILEKSRIPIDTDIRDWRNRIIVPFSNLLNTLKAGKVLKDWWLCDKDRKPLGNGELNFCSLDEFLNYYILFNLEGTEGEAPQLPAPATEKTRKPRGTARAKKA